MSLIGPRPYFADELEDQQKVSQTKELVKSFVGPPRNYRSVASIRP